jgi:predicted transcriptional regulator
MDVIDELCQKLREMEEGETIALLILDYLINDEKKTILLTLLASFRQEEQKQVKLTKLEKAVYDLVQELGAVTIDDVIEHLGDKVDSLKYRTHASDTLNSLVRKGLIGKIVYGKKALYLTPEEAVIQAMKDLDMLPTRCNIKKIAEYTNLSIYKVVSVIEKLL